MDDTHIMQLLSKADAMSKTTVGSSDVSEDAVVLRKRISELESRNAELHTNLNRKETLCNNLTIRLERLLSHRNAETAVHNVSQDHLIATEKSYDHLPRFKTSIGTGAPPCITAIFETLAPKIAYSYEMDNRRTAFTKTECLQLVESIRLEWETSIPSEILTSLVGSKVFKSNAALKDDLNGVDAEPVHFLAYVVSKLYNRAAMVLQEVKKKDSFINLNKVVATEETSNLLPEENIEKNKSRTRWFNNPSLTPYLSKARSSVQHSFAFPSVASCETAVALSIRKLMTKPSLEEILEHLASIIAIEEYALSKSWKLEGNMQ